ncbi:hypothetical protein SAMN05661010_00689 [Modicisalibacter muralis]|uniref:Uncharacterized protein n=1 Tax=Modicisalibacter muralis TaxID=119000 RepID=A0A1G9GER6_9GAMM|nr:hypothetical protein [Halomonas muralis]SDK99149.1 hypothetical protein SAMN05661010_00689 [Halomonas muralis]
MVERSDEPRFTTPIVPDSDSELVARHRPPPVRRRRSRTWPLWLVCLLLTAGLVTLGAYYWIDRQTWLTSQRQLEGQLSNVHARLDSFGDSRGASNAIKQQLSDMQAAQQSLQAELAELRTTLNSLEENSADDAALSELAQELQVADDQRDTLAATLDAMQRSLDIIERSGEEARASLETRVDDLAAAQDEAEQRRQALSVVDDELGARLAQVETTQSQLQASLEKLASGSQDEALADLQGRLEDIAGTLEALQGNDAAQQERLDELSLRVSASQTSLTELRQNQLALNAIIESLDSR